MSQLTRLPRAVPTNRFSLRTRYTCSEGSTLLSINSIITGMCTMVQLRIILVSLSSFHSSSFSYTPRPFLLHSILLPLLSLLLLPPLRPLLLLPPLRPLLLLPPLRPLLLLPPLLPLLLLPPLLPLLLLPLIASPLYFFSYPYFLPSYLHPSPLLNLSYTLTLALPPSHNPSLPLNIPLTIPSSLLLPLSTS